MNAMLLAQFGASLAAILLIAGVVRWQKLGADARLTSDEEARRVAASLVDGFDAVAVGRDRAGYSALLRDAQDRQLLIRSHGARFAGRILTPEIEARLDQHLLTLTFPDGFGRVTLNLGPAAQHWAAGLRRVGVR
jgi:hypothetical protein